MNVPRYCSNCGAQQNGTANFCASCGKPFQKSGDPAPQHPVTAAAAAPTPNAPLPYSPSTAPVQPAVQAAPAPTSETVHLVIPGAARHSGFLGLKVESFVIVCTSLRIIFALQTTQMMQENIKLARDQAEQQGKGFFGKWGAQFSANSGKKYWEIPPQQILAETPDNFAIERQQLRSIRMREEYSDENTASSYKLEFDTTAGKHKFRFGSLNMRELKKQFQQMYGNIVR
jgi:hypothetical protein